MVYLDSLLAIYLIMHSISRYFRIENIKRQQIFSTDTKAFCCFLASQVTKRNLARGYWHVIDFFEEDAYFSNFRFNRNPSSRTSRT